MRSVLKPGFCVEPRDLLIKALPENLLYYVSDREDLCPWADGTVRGGCRHFHSEPQAAEALKAYAC